MGSEKLPMYVVAHYEMLEDGTWRGTLPSEDDMACGELTDPSLENAQARIRAMAKSWLGDNIRIVDRVL